MQQAIGLGDVLGIMASHSKVLPQRQSLYKEKVSEAERAAVKLDALTDLVMWWGPAIARALEKNRMSVNNAFKFGIERRVDEAYRMELIELLGQRFRVMRFSPPRPLGSFVGDYLEVDWKNRE